MELVNQLANNQLTMYIPVALVLVCAILVFAFGFKSAEQPAFDKLSGISDERKPAGKKRKIKEKKQSPINGNVTNSSTIKGGDKSPTKRSPAKETSDKLKEKKNESNAKQTEKIKKEKTKTIEEVKNKKNLKVKTNNNEKPTDFDEGIWEKVPTKSDKKKKQDSPSKKEKKLIKKTEKLETDKIIKDVVNKEIKEQDVDKLIDNKVIEEIDAGKEVLVVEEIEEKKDKKKEKKPKKDNTKEEVVEVEQDTVAAKIADAMKESIVKETIVKEVNEAVAKENSNEKPQEGGVVFDELGDTWTEAKLQKKSKKKARRD